MILLVLLFILDDNKENDFPHCTCNKELLIQYPGINTIPPNDRWQDYHCIFILFSI